MEAIAAIIAGSMLIEVIVSVIKTIYDPKARKISWGQVSSLVVGIVIAIVAGFNLPALVGVTIQVPVIPEIITGIIISRGSNLTYDFINKISGRDKLTT